MVEGKHRSVFFHRLSKEFNWIWVIAWRPGQDGWEPPTRQVVKGSDTRTQHTTETMNTGERTRKRMRSTALHLLGIFLSQFNLA